MKNRNKAVPAAYILLAKDGKYLLGRRKNTGYFDGNYQPPAGHVEEGELPIEAVIREAEEEIGVKLNKKDVLPAHFMYRVKHDETGDRADYFFVARKWEGEIENREPEKCDDLFWASPDKLPKNTVPHARHAIECIQKGVAYSEVDKGFLKTLGVL
jgi:8-oxo-dGTP diphosphatase